MGLELIFHAPPKSMFSPPWRVVICCFIWPQATLPFCMGSCFSSHAVILQGVSTSRVTDPWSQGQAHGLAWTCHCNHLHVINLSEVCMKLNWSNNSPFLKESIPGESRGAFSFPLSYSYKIWHWSCLWPRVQMVERDGGENEVDTHWEIDMRGRCAEKSNGGVEGWGGGWVEATQQCTWSHRNQLFLGLVLSTS